MSACRRGGPSGIATAIDSLRYLSSSAASLWAADLRRLEVRPQDAALSPDRLDIGLGRA